MAGWIGGCCPGGRFAAGGGGVAMAPAGGAKGWERTAPGWVRMAG